MFDVTATFAALSKMNGLEGVVFLLLVLTGMLISGLLRPLSNVQAEQKARDQAHAAEIASRDKQLAEMTRLYDKLSERFDRQQELFDSSLSLIRQEMLPIVRMALPPPNATRQGLT